MISSQTVKYSLRNLKQRKARSFFTILSIFVGITTIFIFVSFGLGLYVYIEELTTGSSADKLMIMPAGWTLAIMESNVECTGDDIKAISNYSGHCAITLYTYVESKITPTKTEISSPLNVFNIKSVFNKMLIPL